MRFMPIALGLLLAVSTLLAQQNDTPNAHIAAAKAAAGEDFQNLFTFQCYRPGPGGPRAAARPEAGVGAQRGPAGAPGGAQRAGGQRAQGPPDRSTWYAEPVKV